LAEAYAVRARRRLCSTRACSGGKNFLGSACGVDRRAIAYAQGAGLRSRKLSAPFVLDPRYGTRCSTILTISYDDELAIAERRFDAAGLAAGESEYVLNAAAT
jgi:hypothetical protein